MTESAAPPLRGLAEALGREFRSLDEAARELRPLAAEGLGTDIDYESIADELGDDAWDLGADLVEAWFDETARRIAACRGEGGALRLYRVMRLPDVDDFVARTAVLGVGCHWTTTQERASSDYDTGQLAEGSDVLLVADAPESSVDWFTTFQAALAHPGEHEVTVGGPLRLLEVLGVGGEAIWRPGAVVPSWGYQPPDPGAPRGP
jgi:hypothetical protein